MGSGSKEAARQSAGHGLLRIPANQRRIVARPSAIHSGKKPKKYIATVRATGWSGRENRRNAVLTRLRIPRFRQVGSAAPRCIKRAEGSSEPLV